MKPYFLSILALLFGYTCFAQLTSNDIRHASGKGPYPIYINFQLSGASAKNMFSDFSQAFADQHGIKHKKSMQGFEGNIGVAINEDNFLWIKNWRVKRFSIEMGYRYLQQNLANASASSLYLKEEVISLRLGMRGNVLYPITYQLQIGPTLHNFASVRIIEETDSGVTVTRDRMGKSLFARTPGENKVVSGLDVRARLMLFDPAGTAGGLGFYLEGRYLRTFGERDLSSFYDHFLGIENREDIKRWDYFSWSIGVIAPLALRIVSF